MKALFIKRLSTVKGRNERSLGQVSLFMKAVLVLLIASFAAEARIAEQFRPRGDFDGETTTDFAVYRPSEGNWYLRSIFFGTTTIKNWGNADDKLVPGD